jgi:hypothetical protein
MAILLGRGWAQGLGSRNFLANYFFCRVSRGRGISYKILRRGKAATASADFGGGGGLDQIENKNRSAARSTTNKAAQRAK